MSYWLPGLSGHDAIADEFQEFLARQVEIFLGRNRFTEMYFHFPQPANRMKPPVLGGNHLHVFDEHRHDRDRALPAR